jgi:hypothetical protein
VIEGEIKVFTVHHTKPARNGKWPVDQLTHSMLRTPSLIVGLGRESHAPTWAAARSVNRCLSIPIGWLRVDPERSKPVLNSLSIEP